MAKKIRQISLPDGNVVDVEEMDFDIINEDWAEYQLVDGTTLRMKTNLLKVFRVLDENGNRVITPDGDPFIVVRSSNQIVASE